jgi:hypothetical protein
MKGKLVVVAIVLALLYGGYFIFYGSSPVGDVVESLSSEEQEASYALGSEFEEGKSEPSGPPENLERRATLVGTWAFDYVTKNAQFIDRIKGTVKYNEDGTFSRTATYTHYGSDPNHHRDMYRRSPQMINGHIITRGGVKYSGTWAAYDDIWTETSSNCVGKITITKLSGLGAPFYGSNPCDYFDSGIIKYGTREAGFQSWNLKKFTANEILLSFEDFENGGNGSLVFKKK